MKKLQHVKKNILVWNKIFFVGLNEKKYQIWDGIQGLDLKLEEVGLLPPGLNGKAKRPFEMEVFLCCRDIFIGVEKQSVSG